MHGLGRVEFRHPLLEALDIGGLVVLGHAQLALDHLELFLQEEFALVLLDFRVHLFADFRLQPGNFLLFAHQQKNLLHAAEQGDGVEHILQLFAWSAGH